MRNSKIIYYRIDGEVLTNVERKRRGLTLVDERLWYIGENLDDANAPQAKAKP